VYGAGVGGFGLLPYTGGGGETTYPAWSGCPPSSQNSEFRIRLRRASK